MLSKQQADGGWGETFESCTTWEYQQNTRSQVVGTAWALLSLLFAEYPDRAPLQRGVDFLMRRQLPNGNWAQEVRRQPVLIPDTLSMRVDSMRDTSMATQITLLIRHTGHLGRVQLYLLDLVQWLQEHFPDLGTRPLRQEVPWPGSDYSSHVSSGGSMLAMQQI